MKKKVSLVLVLALVLVSVLQFSPYKIKASEKNDSGLVVTEITEEEYLEYLKKEGKSTAVPTIANDDIVIPTPIPSNVNDSKLVVTEITEEEYLEYLKKEGKSISPTVANDTIAVPTPIPSQKNLVKASYTSKVVNKYFSIYTMGGDYLCAGKGAYTVWYYTDGKVHLSSRTISVTNGSGNVEYGSIVNTDGSVSYTSGDNINKFFFFGGWEYHYLNFIVTSSQAELDIVSEY